MRIDNYHRLISAVWGPYTSAHAHINAHSTMILDRHLKALGDHGDIIQRYFGVGHYVDPKSYWDISFETGRHPNLLQERAEAGISILRRREHSKEILAALEVA